MISRDFPLRNKTTHKTRALKEALVTSFACPPETAEELLRGYSSADWESLLWWLDISGMALYFLDSAQQLKVTKMIDPSVEAGLMRRLQRNEIRTRALQQEAAVLVGWFRTGRVEYALLKGATLAPDSVPSVLLRSQADLDFLVAQRHLRLAIHYVHRLGYRLHASSGNSLEFRAGPATLPNLNNIYSVRTQRALELHVADDRSDLLGRRVSRFIQGEYFDALSSADILVQQSVHLLKHLCGEHTRLSWVLEFRRHIKARSKDRQFWDDVHRHAAAERHGDLAMGVAVWVAQHMFGPLEFSVCPQWREEALPIRVRLWLERYAFDLLLSDSAGSKLYALLRNEVLAEPGERRSLRRLLLPTKLPLRLTEHASTRSEEHWSRRFVIEADYFLRRLYFHLTEGIRFIIEVARWKVAIVRCQL